MLVDLGALPVAQTVALVLAQIPDPPPGKGDEFGKASPVGLVVVVLLFLATIFLIRSMNKQLRKVPVSFDEPAGAPGAGGGADEVVAAPGNGARSTDEPADGPARD